MSESIVEHQEHRGNAEFLASYKPLTGYFDETLLGGGKLRPHWEQFRDSLNAMGSAEFARRWQQTQRLIHEHGLAYSTFGDPTDKARPWELDPLPVLIPAVQWRQVSAALKQRAHLLDLILADLYGPQDLIKRGLLPPEVVFDNPNFRRPIHNLRPRDDRYLHLYAADLARAPDGKWWVLGDRTEAPSGSGYALENRIVTSRMLTDAFHDCQVERLAPYFVALRETIQQIAPHHAENPHVAMLSQGRKFANYFEDAYLARYLGYTLVEGDDLTVRDNQVMMKTLDGLVPIDVILRRPNSEDCDPLELSGASRLGTPGILQAVRRGAAAVVNPLGSGLIESPIFMAYLPRLCRELLSEEPLIPGVATWWCGEPSSLKHVLANLDRLLIRKAFRKRGQELHTSSDLINKSKSELADMIRAAPESFVAQEQVARSTMPIWRQHSVASSATPSGKDYSLGASHIALRTFAVASNASYYVMNGGLARVSHSVDPLFVSLLAGERSKDVWVLADEPVAPVTLLGKHTAALPLRRSGAELPSRMADHIFWLGRNLERADAAARLLRTVALRITAETYSADLEDVPILLRVLVEQGHLEPGYVVAGIRDQLPAIEHGLPPAVLDETQSSSLRSIVSQLLQSASVVRDRISLDCWRILKRLDEQFRPSNPSPLTLSELLELIDSLLIELAAFSGLAMESMTRTYTWRFLDLGRRMERALQTLHLLRHSLLETPAAGASILEAILEIADSVMTYRARYLANLQLGPVLDLLLTDETNPRSIAFQLVNIVEHVHALPRDPSQATFSKEQRLAMSALHSVRMLDVTAMAEIKKLGRNEELSRFLEGLEYRIPELSDAISHRYLTHSGPTQHLGENLAANPKA